MLQSGNIELLELLMAYVTCLTVIRGGMNPVFSVEFLQIVKIVKFF